MDDVSSCRESERGDIILEMSILCGDFFFETCQTNQAQHAFFNWGIVFFRFLLPPFLWLFG